MFLSGSDKIAEKVFLNFEMFYSKGGPRSNAICFLIILSPLKRLLMPLNFKKSVTVDVKRRGRE